MHLKDIAIVTIDLSNSETYRLYIDIGPLDCFYSPFSISTHSDARIVLRHAVPKTVNSTPILVISNYLYMPIPSAEMRVNGIRRVFE